MSFKDGGKGDFDDTTLFISFVIIFAVVVMLVLRTCGVEV